MSLKVFQDGEGYPSAPRLIDPGGGGWPDPPKVTTGEERLYGPDLAAVVRLLSNAAVATTDAYALICKAASEDFPATTQDAERQSAWWQVLIEATWEVHLRTEEAARMVAERLIQRQRNFHARRLHETVE